MILLKSGKAAGAGLRPLFRQRFQVSKRKVTKAAKATARDLFQKLEVEPQSPPARGNTPVERPRAAGRSAEDHYTAADIEVLEGLEPVRRRPGI